MAGDVKQTQSSIDEAHSNGTVQDFHLIPVSSVPSQMEVSEQDSANVEKNLDNPKGKKEFF